MKIKKMLFSFDSQRAKAEINWPLECSVPIVEVLPAVQERVARIPFSIDPYEVARKSRV